MDGAFPYPDQFATLRLALPASITDGQIRAELTRFKGHGGQARYKLEVDHGIRTARTNAARPENHAAEVAAMHTRIQELLGPAAGQYNRGNAAWGGQTGPGYSRIRPCDDMTDTASAAYIASSNTRIGPNTHINLTQLPAGSKVGRACKAICSMRRCKYFIVKNGKRKRCCNCVGTTYQATGLCHWHQGATADNICNYPAKMLARDYPAAAAAPAAADGGGDGDAANGPGAGGAGRRFEANDRAALGTLKRRMFNRSSIGLKARFVVTALSGVRAGQKAYKLQFQVHLPQGPTIPQAVWTKVGRWTNVFDADVAANKFTAEVPVRLKAVVSDANGWAADHQTVDLYLQGVSNAAGYHNVSLSARNGDFEGLEVRVSNPFQEGPMNDWLYSALPAPAAGSDDAPPPQPTLAQQKARALGRPVQNHLNFEPDGEGLAYSVTYVRSIVDAAYKRLRRRIRVPPVDFPVLPPPWIDPPEDEDTWKLVEDLPDGAISAFDAIQELEERYRTLSNEKTRDPRKVAQELHSTINALKQIGTGNPYIWKKPSGFHYKQGQAGFTKEFVTKMLAAFAEMGIRPCSFNTKFKCFNMKEAPGPGCAAGGDGRPAGGAGPSSAGTPGLNYSYPRLQPYQFTCRYICTPEFENVIRRFLIVHELGTGKTLTMIEILDNFFYDSRPKIVVVPRPNLADNFLREMLVHRTLYRDWLELRLGTATLLTALGQGNPPPSMDATSAALGQCKELLRCKGLGAAQLVAGTGDNQLVMGAPLRIYSYKEAGDESDEPMWRRGQADGVPRSTGIDWRTHFQDKVVLLDEVQNFLGRQARQTAMEMGGDPEVATRKIQNVKTKVSRAGDHAVVYSFTATPIISQPSDTNELLQAVTGSAQSNANREGYVSFFMARPRVLYAVSTDMPADDPCKYALRIVPLKGDVLVETLKYAGKKLVLRRQPSGEDVIQIVDLPQNQQASSVARYEAGETMDDESALDRRESRFLQTAERREHTPKDERFIVQFIQELERIGLPSGFSYAAADNAHMYTAPHPTSSHPPVGAISSREYAELAKRCEANYPKMFQMILACLSELEPINSGPAPAVGPVMRHTGPAGFRGPPKTLLLQDSNYIRTFAAMLRCFTPSNIAFGVVNSAPQGVSKFTEGQKQVRKGQRLALIDRFRGPTNICGTQMRFLIADAQNYSEGESFFNCRRLIVDVGYVNNSYMKLRQQVGRVLRSGGHAALPPEERTVQVLIFASRITALGIAQHAAALNCTRNQTIADGFRKCISRPATERTKPLTVPRDNATYASLRTAVARLSLPQAAIDAADPGAKETFPKGSMTPEQIFALVQRINNKYSSLPRIQLVHNGHTYTEDGYRAIQHSAGTVGPKPTRGKTAEEKASYEQRMRNHEELKRRAGLAKVLKTALGNLVKEAKRREAEQYENAVSEFRTFVQRETQRHNDGLADSFGVGHYLRALQAGGYSMYEAGGTNSDGMTISINRQLALVRIRDDMTLENIRSQGLIFANSECALNAIALDRILLARACYPNDCIGVDGQIQPIRRRSIAEVASLVLAGSANMVTDPIDMEALTMNCMKEFFQPLKDDRGLLKDYEAVAHRYGNAMQMALFRFIAEENQDICGMIWPAAPPRSAWGGNDAHRMAMLADTFVYHSTEGLRVGPAFREQLLQVYRSGKMMAIASMSLIQTSGLHANVVIVKFDHHGCELIRFEPHGHKPDSVTDHNINSAFASLCNGGGDDLTSFLHANSVTNGAPVRYVSPEHLFPPSARGCRLIGVQALEASYHHLFDATKQFNALGGTAKAGDKTAMITWVEAGRNRISVQGVFGTGGNNTVTLSRHEQDGPFDEPFYIRALDAMNKNLSVALSYPEAGEQAAGTTPMVTITIGSGSSVVAATFVNPQLDSSAPKLRKDAKPGLCSLWSAMFVHLMVKNPFLSPEVVHNILRRDPNTLGQMIRTYACIMYETVLGATVVRDNGTTLSMDVGTDRHGRLTFQPFLNHAQLTAEDVTRMKANLAAAKQKYSEQGGGSGGGGGKGRGRGRGTGLGRTSGGAGSSTDPL